MRFTQPRRTSYYLFGIVLTVLLLQFETTGAEESGDKFEQDNKIPLVINTWAFREANAAAWSVLHERPVHGSGLDALVEGCTTCERLQCDGTVGYGGSPDENGDTTLDAMVMDGRTMNIGAVGGMRDIKDAARVARHVLEHTHHTLLIGESATMFAEMMGFPRETLNTPTSIAMWQQWRNKGCQPNFWVDVYPDSSKHCGPYIPQQQMSECDKDDRDRYEFGRLNHDTIGMIVVDPAANIFAGTSTNGARYKIPGRVGDSPIPGAGAYADNEVGAAVATGDGDIMMRFLPSLLAVEGLRAGRSPSEAAESAIARIARFYPDFSGALVVVSQTGDYAAACMGMERFPFSVAGGGSGDKQRTRVEYVDCKKDWK